MASSQLRSWDSIGRGGRDFCEALLELRGVDGVARDGSHQARR
jgi:hypothetical protein